MKKGEWTYKLTYELDDDKKLIISGEFIITSTSGNPNSLIIRGTRTKVATKTKEIEKSLDSEKQKWNGKWIEYCSDEKIRFSYIFTFKPLDRENTDTNEVTELPMFVESEFIYKSANEMTAKQRVLLDEKLREKIKTSDSNKHFYGTGNIEARKTRVAK